MSFQSIWARITANRDNANVPDHGKDQLTFAVLSIYDAMTRLTEAEVYTEPHDPKIAVYRYQLRGIAEAIQNNQYPHHGPTA